MQTRQVIGFVLLALLIAGLAFSAWLAFYNSGDRVRRRNRRDRRAHYRTEQASRDDAENGGAGASD